MKKETNNNAGFGTNNKEEVNMEKELINIKKEIDRKREEVSDINALANKYLEMNILNDSEAISERVKELKFESDLIEKEIRILESKGNSIVLSKKAEQSHSDFVSKVEEVRAKFKKKLEATEREFKKNRKNLS